MRAEYDVSYGKYAKNAKDDKERWNVIVHTWWRELFNIDKFETVNRKFAGEILTDGNAVSIVLRKPKKKVVSRKIDLSRFSVQ